MNKPVLYFISSLTLMLAACSTEVDVNAPYRETTVVYGLLDPVADTQWVKINKTFLGDGNNLDYATVRDSSEYAFDLFDVLQVKDVQSGQVYPLDSLTIHNKELNGIFYAPHQTVYYFLSPGGLDQSHEYELYIRFVNGKEVKAKTALVQPSQIQTIPAANSSTTLVLCQNNTNGLEYKTANFKWTPVASAPFYELTLQLNYTEYLWADLTHTILVSQQAKTVSYYVGKFGENDISTSGQINGSINGESFFSYLGSTLEKNPFITRQIGFFDLSVSPQRTRCFDVVLAMGGEELYTYVQVNTPVTGIVQERPGYTNVDNGLGLFSSRSAIEINNINLINSSGIPNPGNLIGLVTSPYTVELNFCDPNPASLYPCN